MIRYIHRCVVAMTVCMAVGTSSNVIAQNVIYQQDPIAFGNPSTGITGLSSIFVEATGAESISRGYDNFVITEPVSISGLEWKGSFNGPFNPRSSFRGRADFSVEFFPNTTSKTGDTPDTSNPILSLLLDGGLAGRENGSDVVSMVVPNEMSSGSGGGGVGQPPAPGIVETYSLDIKPFTLEPGTYWLAIQALQTFPSPFPPQNADDPDRWFDPSWSWALSDDPDGDHTLYSFDTLFGDRLEDDGTIGPGIVINSPNAPRDLAFTLTGSSESSIPDGDYDEDGELTAADIDLLTAGIRTCGDACFDFDLNQDGVADADDLDFWVRDIKGTLPGDANLDGTVQFPDFLIMSRNFAGTGGWGEGNFTTDTLVNFPDFLVLSRNFGLSAGDPGVANGEAAAVPEPSAVLLASIGGLVLLPRRRRRN